MSTAYHVITGEAGREFWFPGGGVQVKSQYLAKPELRGSNASFSTITFVFMFSFNSVASGAGMMSPILAAILEQTTPGPV